MTDEPIPDPAPAAQDAAALPATRPPGRRKRGARGQPAGARAAAPAGSGGTRAPRGAAADRPTPAPVHPVLEQLAGLYPHLFGAVFLPLKRGIFQDLMAAHPDRLNTESLKEALARHTRSTRYLIAVASGQQRHDLQGQPVEVMAPEHVHHALLEVFRRRQGRGGDAEELRTKLVARIVAAIESSGLARDAYAERMRSQRDEAANALLDEALAVTAARAAKDEALLRAFHASGQTDVPAFADMYGMDAREVTRALERAGRGPVAADAPADD